MSNTGCTYVVFNQMNSFEIKIKYKKNVLLIFVITFSLIISLGIAISTYGTDIFPFTFIFLFFSILFYFKWYKQKHGYEKLVISSPYLVHDKYVNLKLKKRSEYNLLEIENLEYRTDENSEDYVSPVTITIGGIPNSPKSTRKYSTNPTTLHFDYYGEHIKIGEGLEKFDAMKFVRKIHEMKNNSENN